MKKKGFAILALDTSNYTTSIAIINNLREIIIDNRIPLKVAQGERGLRQSHALFQHSQNLPDMLEECFFRVSPVDIGAVSVSDRPRRVSGSYMPVFNAGVSCGKILSLALEVPIFKFSHQEGHLAAASYGKSLKEPYLALHLSGGTTELLLIKENTANKIGGTLDISFGQLIDRVGVKAGLNFPAGHEMDNIAVNSYKCSTGDILKPVYFQGLNLNLSGLETQALKWIEKKRPNIDTICSELFSVIGDALIRWSQKAMEQTGCRGILLMGGVARSKTIRKIVMEGFTASEQEIVFGSSPLCSDNAVGTGLLGADKLWQ